MRKLISGASACRRNDSSKFDEGQVSFLLKDFALEAFIFCRWRPYSGLTTDFEEHTQLEEFEGSKGAICRRLNLFKAF